MSKAALTSDLTLQGLPALLRSPEFPCSPQLCTSNSLSGTPCVDKPTSNNNYQECGFQLHPRTSYMICKLGMDRLCREKEESYPRSSGMIGAQVLTNCATTISLGTAEAACGGAAPPPLPWFMGQRARFDLSMVVQGEERIPDKVLLTECLMYEKLEKVAHVTKATYIQTRLVSQM